MFDLIEFDTETDHVLDKADRWVRHKANLVSGTCVETSELRHGSGYLLVPTNAASASVDIESVCGRFPSVSYLRILGKEHNLSALSKFGSLRCLWIVKVPARESISIKDLRQLSGLYVESFARITDFAGAGLESLILFRCKSGFTDLSFLAGFPNLKRLWLIGGNYVDLTGLKNTPHLLDLRLVDLKHLQSFDGLEHAAPSLKSLEIDSCHKAGDLAPLATLRDLRCLFLFNRKSFPDLSFCQDMKRLAFISFPQTDVLDGTISRLDELPELKKAVFTNKRHFDRSPKDIMKRQM